MMTGNHQQPAGQRPATPDDAWLETLLREDAAAASPVDDAGFSASVMRRLPARTCPPPRRWIVPAMGLLGCLIGLVWLSGGVNLSLYLASLVQLKSLSLQTFLAAALPLGLLYWLALGAALRQP